MTVIVTGATGFLGKATVEFARRSGLGVIPIAHRDADGHMSIDLEDNLALSAALKNLRPSAIINCAAVVDFGSDVLARQYRVNVLAPAIMSGWAARHDALLVQASATLVHGAQIERVDPKTPLEPNTDYGRSKWLAEEMIGASGCRAAIIRFGGIFGLRGPDHLGVNRAIRAAGQGEAPILQGTGRARRNYVYVEDAAEALVTCVVAPLLGTFRMGGPSILSVRSMLEAICEVYGLDRKPIGKPGPDGPDQIVETSPELPPGRSFVDALIAERSEIARVKPNREPTHFPASPKP